MKVCFPIPVFPPDTGGIATFYDNFSTLLSEQGHEVTVLTVDNEAEPDAPDVYTDKNGIQIVVLKKSYIKHKDHYKIYFKQGGFAVYEWIAMGLSFRIWLLENHKERGIDILQVADYGGLGFFLSSNELPPIIVFGHGSLTQIGLINFTNKNDCQYKIIKDLEIFSLKNADAIFTHSPLNQENLKHIANRDIHLCIPAWKNNLPSNSKPDSPPKILVAGGLQIVKGAMVMAKAVSEYVKINPELCLSWVGGDTYTADKYTSVAELIKDTFPEIWNKNFIWLDSMSRKEVLFELTKATIIIVPSVWETFGWTAIEAASAGKALIITENTGASYLFTNNHDAIIIPSNNPYKLAEALELLINNPRLCVTLGENARSMIHRMFDEKATIETFIKEYNNVINNRRPNNIRFEENFSFIGKYTTKYRKIYFRLRLFLKNIISQKK